MTASPSGPDWLDIAIRPADTSTVANVATIDVGGTGLTSPMQLGPSSRMPLARANVTIWCCNARPSGPASAKPADSTTTEAVPTLAASARTSGTYGAGTQT